MKIVGNLVFALVVLIHSVVISYQRLYKLKTQLQCIHVRSLKCLGCLFGPHCVYTEEFFDVIFLPPNLKAIIFCGTLQDDTRKPFWTFDVYPAEVPDVLIMGTRRHIGRLTLVARGDWIIGWVDNNDIRPIYNEGSEIICKNIYTGATPTFRESNPFIMSIGVYGPLPPNTPHHAEILLPKLPINQSAYPGIYGHY